jgi:hypothetical protein
MALSWVPQVASLHLGILLGEFSLQETPVSGVRWTPPRVRKPDRTAKADQMAGVTSNYSYDAACPSIRANAC